ncbi:energy transducer TonB [Marinospirillum celere]|uniref:energy transducer TonB n=1 Tax=Marinospirillum celere TaxID=1122252 RepID=UPI0015A602BF|nr:energy transducer TonB [Marinospirillum celere]
MDTLPTAPEATQQRRGSLIARSREMARLEAELAAQQETSRSRPRVRRISSNSQMTSEEALYLQQWEERVERIGNLNYPEEARRQGLTGSLRLLVSINADGSIREAQLLTASGHQLLDEAALNILRLAAPFPPLPESLREESEVLEIVRTWRFGSNWRAN